MISFSAATTAHSCWNAIPRAATSSGSKPKTGPSQRWKALERALRRQTACHAQITLHLNNAILPPPADKPAIIPTLWKNEALISFRNPSATKNAITAPSVPQLGEIADYAISVEAYPRGASLTIGKGDGLKVLFGPLMFPKEDGGNDGMAQLKPEYTDAHNDSGEYDELPREAFDWLPMRQLKEYGGLSDRDSDGRPTRSGKKVDTVQYPTSGKPATRRGTLTSGWRLTLTHGLSTRRWRMGGILRWLWDNVSPEGTRTEKTAMMK